MRFIKNKLLLIFISIASFAQAQHDSIVDQVIAIVGNKIALQSELEANYAKFLSSGNYPSSTVKCQMMDQLILSKMLLHHAIIDSVDVKDDQVEREMDQRMNYFINQFGSKEKMEEVYGKSIIEWKEDFRPIIKDQLQTKAMYDKVTSGAVVSPSDIKDYFASFQTDSLPFMNAEIEYAQIVRVVKYSDEAKKECKETLEKLRQRVINGEDFAALAVLYSQDKGSAKNGGELGFFNRGDLVPEFSAAALKLKPGDISQIVLTKFGYHIIQMIERRGDLLNVRHILIRPLITEDDEAKTVAFLDSVSSLIKNDSLNFGEAAEKFSEDDTRQNGGTVSNPQTGNARFEVDQLDPSLFFQLDQLQPGEFTKPLPFATEDGKTAYRLLTLKLRTKPHVANLNDDYQYFSNAAASEKSDKALQDWLKRKLPSTFIHINQEYLNCDNLKKWIQAKD